MLMLLQSIFFMDMITEILFALFVALVVILALGYLIIKGISVGIRYLMGGGEETSSSSSSSSALPKKAFLQRLPQELRKWVEKGIITEEIKQKIADFYIQEAPAKADMKSKAPLLLVSLACILLGIGLFMFYAANWQYMDPAFKFVQVLFVIILIYTTSYYFLNRPGFEHFGRAFLVLGMVSFGVGIALVAQIFNIPPQGGTGLLIWTVGTLLMSGLMREKWGYYLASVIAFIWTSQEFFAYQHHNFLFPVIALILLWAFYQSKAKIGIIIMIFQLIFWIFQATIAQLGLLESQDYALQNTSIRCFIFLFAPLGLVLVCLSRFAEKNTELLLPAQVFTFMGWLFTFVPLLGLSWPLPNLEHLYPLTDAKALNFLHIEYILFVLLALFLIHQLRRKELDVRLPQAVFLCTCLFYFLPFGLNKVSIIMTHLGLLGFLTSMLFFSHHLSQPRPLEKTVAFGFMMIVLLAKCILFFGFGVDSREFYLAYCMGFIVFGTVCFLLVLVVELLLEKRQRLFVSAPLHHLMSLLAFLIIYALSFRVEDQKSVFNADPIVLTMLFMFLGIALVLYAYLYLKSENKLKLSMSAIIFFLSLFVLFISGPEVSWITYSLFFNFLLFTLEGTLIYYGIQANSSKTANLGIFIFLVHIVTRYFDLLFDLLSGAPLFISMGLLVFACGYVLEKRRLSVKKTTSVSGKEN
jgi:uncharacterized membrane protein